MLKEQDSDAIVLYATESSTLLNAFIMRDNNLCVSCPEIKLALDYLQKFEMHCKCMDLHTFSEIL